MAESPRRSLLGAVIAVVLLFLGCSAASVALMIVVRTPGLEHGAALQTLPAALIFGFVGFVTWVAARLWPKWRLGLGGCLLFQAAMSVQLARMVPPAHETGSVARNYFIVAVVLAVVAAAALIWHVCAFWRRRGAIAPHDPS